MFQVETDLMAGCFIVSGRGHSRGNDRVKLRQRIEAPDVRIAGLLICGTFNAPGQMLPVEEVLRGEKASAGR
jgi:hypothetical protein